MNRYNDFKQELLQINNDLAGLIKKGASVPGATKGALGEWARSCQTLQRQLSEENLRVAVVGTIKSGKSTFMNSLLGGDYLKRGAGVVTSIVTRINSGPRPVARLLFKSWPEVNQDIAKALTFLPSAQNLFLKNSFDIRNHRSRESIEDLIKDLPVEQLVSNGTRNLNSVLIANYLVGYDRVMNILAEQNVIKNFENAEFIDHWQYVGDDALAVYLKDLQLELNSSHIDSDTELADCQGSDSSNPLHLAMIQDYLQEAHLIIYVVSSRTGLREADIKFLSIIRKMGLSSSVMLVVNVDISEHESLIDLRQLVNRVSNELDLIITEPQCYTVSALFHLFDILRENLSQKDRMRLVQWEHQTDIADFSRTEYQRFQRHLRRRLVRKRYQLMFKSQIERHGIILAGMSDWISINREFLSRSDGDIRKFIDSITAQQERVNNLRTGIESTTSGAMTKIKSEVNVDVNRFFDNHSGPYISQLFGFIRDYQVDIGKYQGNLEKDGFLSTIYVVFQEFKHALDTMMTDTLYPEIVNFVRGEEKKIEKQLKATLNPFASIVEQGLAELRSDLHDFGADGSIQNRRLCFDLPDFDAVKAAAGLHLPPLVPFLEYSNRIKTEAFINAGYFSLLKLFKKIFHHQSPTRTSSTPKMLQRSVRQMKIQTEESILFQCKNYRENLKFAYLHRLVEEATQRFADNLMDRFRIFANGTVEMTNHVSQLENDKDRAIETVREMEEIVASTGEKMTSLRLQIE